MRCTRGWAGRRRGTQAVRVQVLFENGEDVKRRLQLLARRHDPDAPGALATLLRESALLLLRPRADWAYGTAERRAGAGEDEANSLVGGWATAARATFETQTTGQYQNGDAAGGYDHGASVPARTWPGYTQQAGVTCTLHQLRHSHATELVNGGVSLGTIRKRLGHRHIQTTLRHAEVSDRTADAEVRAWRRKHR